jgi:hypothetical protein
VLTRYSSASSDVTTSPTREAATTPNAGCPITLVWSSILVSAGLVWRPHARVSRLSRPSTVGDSAVQTFSTHQFAQSIITITSAPTCTALTSVPEPSASFPESYNQMLSSAGVTGDPSSPGNINANSGFPPLTNPSTEPTPTVKPSNPMQIGPVSILADSASHSACIS